jgi:hypothetical protein
MAKSMMVAERRVGQPSPNEMVQPVSIPIFQGESKSEDENLIFLPDHLIWPDQSTVWEGHQVTFSE